MPAAEMVTTSLKMPQMLRVTTEVRCRRANSDEVIRKARMPGKRRMQMAMKAPLASVSEARPVARGPGPSTGRAMIRREANMMGAR